MSWQLVFSKHAEKDAKKLAAAGLKTKAQELLAVLVADPFQNPPPLREARKRFVRRILKAHQYSTSLGLRSYYQRTRGSSAPHVDAL